MRQDIASFRSGGWIDRDAPFIDVLNDPLFVDDERCSIAEALFFIKDSVVFHHRSLEITEQRKRYADVLCKAAIGGNAVYADAENLSFCSFEFGDISLIRLKFFRSTTGEGQHIEGQHDIFLVPEIA